MRSAKKSVPSTYEKAARRISKTRLPTETRQTSQFPKQVHSNIVPHSGPCENVLPKSSTRAVNSKRSIVPVEQPHKTLQREDDVNMFAGPQVPDEQAVDEELYINTEQQKRTGKISTAWKPTRNLGKNLRRRGRGGHVRSSERGRVEIKSSSNPSQEVSSWTYVDGSQGKEPSFERPSLPFAAPVNEMLNGQRSVSRKRAVQTPNKVWRKAKQPRNNQITQLNVHRNWRGGRGGHQSFRRGKGARGGRWNGVEEDKRGNFEMKQEVHVIDDSQTDFEADDHTSMAASHIHPSQTWVGAQQPTHC